jgi:hypothetical protein
MKKKVAKKLRLLADAIGFNKTPQERKKIYRRFKNIHNATKEKRSQG